MTETDTQCVYNNAKESAMQVILRRELIDSPFNGQLCVQKVTTRLLASPNVPLTVSLRLLVFEVGNATGNKMEVGNCVPLRPIAL